MLMLTLPIFETMFESHDSKPSSRDTPRRTSLAPDYPDLFPPGASKVAREWKPPWPPIRISDCEWIIMRSSDHLPAAVIRSMKMGPRQERFYRVVTWAETSEKRTLVGYYESFEEADRAVLFDNPSPKMPDVRTASGWGPTKRPEQEVSPGKANSPARTERD